MTLKAKTKTPFLICFTHTHENLLKGKDTQSSLQASKHGIIFPALSPNIPFLDIFITADFGKILTIKNIRSFIIHDFCFGEGLLSFDIHMLYPQEHQVFVGSSGFGWRYFTDLSQMRVPSSGMSANVSLYPLIPLKSWFNSDLPLFKILEKKCKICLCNKAKIIS